MNDKEKECTLYTCSTSCTVISTATLLHLEHLISKLLLTLSYKATSQLMYQGRLNIHRCSNAHQCQATISTLRLSNCLMVTRCVCWLHAHFYIREVGGYMWMFVDVLLWQASLFRCSSFLAHLLLAQQPKCYCSQDCSRLPVSSACTHYRIPNMLWNCLSTFGDRSRKGIRFVTRRYCFVEYLIFWLEL